MVTCRYNVPVVSPGKTKSEKLTKQNKTKQNGFYDINIEGHASTASPSPSLWQALEKTGCAPLLCEWREVLSHCQMVQRTSLQEDCPADHPGLQGASCSPRAPGRAFSAPTESMMQRLPSCWCLLCRMTCRFDTCLHCTSLAMLARTSMAEATRTHLPCSPPVCWQQLLCAYEEGGCLRLTAQAPAVSLAPSARGWALRPLRIADYNNYICICFVLFSFVIFSLFCFSRGHNWDIKPASRHKGCAFQSQRLPRFLQVNHGLSIAKFKAREGWILMCPTPLTHLWFTVLYSYGMHAYKKFC